MSRPELICVRCRKLIEVNALNYELFERMHWLCFHLEFEHEADPDEPCSDPTCPWWTIEVYERKLKQLGYDPREIITQAIGERWQ